MKKSDLGQIITILANVGVIAGILFLAVELRQNNNLMSDEAERARAESRRESWALLADNSELAAIMVRERAGEQLTAAEEFQLVAYWTRDMIGYQTSFQQLPREELVNAAIYFREVFGTSPSLRKAWEEYRVSLDPDFVEFMEQSVVSDR
jgi:hypothetical protein